MSQRGEMTINGKDAWDTFGVFILEGSVQTLMTPPANKAFIENESRMQHGKRVIVKDRNDNSLIRVSDRDITLPMCVKAENQTKLIEKLNAFVDELNAGEVKMEVSHFPGTVFHLIHKGAPTPSGHIRGMALFSFKFNEPNPKNRT